LQVSSSTAASPSRNVGAIAGGVVGGVVLSNEAVLVFERVDAEQQRIETIPRRLHRLFALIFAASAIYETDIDVPLADLVYNFENVCTDARNNVSERHCRKAIPIVAVLLLMSSCDARDL